jgi:integrase
MIEKGYTMTSVKLGLFSVSVPYLHKPKGRHTWHYRRAVPVSVKSHYSQSHILKSLNTTDEVEAARISLKLNQQYEQEFDRLKRGLSKQPDKAIYQLALDKLNEFGIYKNVAQDNSAAPNIADDFLEHLGQKLQAQIPTKEFEDIWYRGSAIPDGLLDTVDSAALEMMHGKYRPCASQYAQEYFVLSGRQEDKKFTDSVERALGYLFTCLPDKPPGDYTRAEVRRLIKYHSENGKIKSATLHRQLTMLRAMFNKVSKENELKEDILHPFRDFDIPHCREDATDRKDFTNEELDRLRQFITGRKPQIATLIHLMLETGLRVNECCGLRIEDVYIDAEVPYVIVRKNPFRQLKTKGSQRYIPLVGVALSSLTELINNNGIGDWVFPDYIDGQRKDTKNTAASAAANKRIKSILGKGSPTSHSFRHTFNSRLRNVECPRDIRDELGGWASSVSDRYGSPADIKIKQDYLLKSITAPSGVKM